MRRGLSVSALALACLAAPPAVAQSWMRVTGIDTTRGVYSVATSAGVFFAATDSLIYRSSDGLSWQAAASQPASGIPYYVLTASGAALFAATDGQGVYRSVNGGLSWTPLGSGLPQETVIDLAVLGDSLYAGLGFSGVYVLNLASPGAWTPYTTGLTQFGANSLSVAGDRLYAGLGAGLFVRDRGGARWNEASWGDGLQRQAFEVVAADSFLFAATEAGVFRARAADPLRWEARDIPAMRGRNILALAVQGKRVYAGLNQSLQHWIWSSDDAGETWDVRAHEYAEIWAMRFSGNRMWAARQDGLWYYDFAPVSLARGRRPALAVPRGVPGIRGGACRLDGRRVREAPRTPALPSSARE